MGEGVEEPVYGDLVDKLAAGLAGGAGLAVGGTSVVCIVWSAESTTIPYDADWINLICEIADPKWTEGATRPPTRQ